MKYLLAGLIFFATICPLGATEPISPLFPVSASASFAITDQGGTSTEVGLDVRDSSPFAQVSIFIRRERQVCAGGACQQAPVIDASTVQVVAPRDAFIDRQLSDGYLHGMFRLHDDVTNADLVVRVDAEWNASQPPICAALDVGGSCARAATVLADVSSGSDRFVADQSIPDGQIIWQLPT